MNLISLPKRELLRHLHAMYLVRVCNKRSLKIIEGTTANIQLRGKNHSHNQETVQIDTSNILFICGGSFEGLEKIVESRLGKRSMGFLKKEKQEEINAERELFAKATPEDLDKFGLIPEFIGRLPVIATMQHLDEDSLVRILKEPKNSLVKQYQKLVQFGEGATSLQKKHCMPLKKHRKEKQEQEVYVQSSNLSCWTSCMKCQAKMTSPSLPLTPIPSMKKHPQNWTYKDSVGVPS